MPPPHIHHLLNPFNHPLTPPPPPPPPSWRSPRGRRITCLRLYMTHLFPGWSLYSSVCLLHCHRCWEEIGGSVRSVQMLLFGLVFFCFFFFSCIYALESVGRLLFNMCPALFIAIPGSKRNKKTLFSCRGCNSELSKPIVLPRRHLFFPCIVY